MLTGLALSCVLWFRSCEWTLVPGCLAPQGKEQKAAEVLGSLVTAPPKETLSLINKHVSVSDVCP